MDIKNKEALIAEINNFKKEALKMHIVEVLAKTYEHSSLFDCNIDVDGSVIWYKAQARQLWDFWKAAKAQAVPEVKLSRSITLTCAQLREAFMFGAPDKDDQEQLETEMTITWSEDGHSGKGYYCYYSELPEEGAIFLDEVIEAQEQSHEYS